MKNEINIEKILWIIFFMIVGLFTIVFFASAQLDITKRNVTVTENVHVRGDTVLNSSEVRQEISEGVGGTIIVDSIKGSEDNYLLSNGLVIKGYDDVLGYGGGEVEIKGGIGVGGGGNINIRGGEANGSARGGYVILTGGDTYQSGAKGGGIQLNAGYGKEDTYYGGDGGGGEIQLNAGGSEENGDGGDIRIQSGNANTGNAGNILLTTQTNSSDTYGYIKFESRIYQYSGSLTDGVPTDSEITFILEGGSASLYGAGFQATIKDTDGTELLYKIESDGTDWYYIIMTKAL